MPTLTWQEVVEYNPAAAKQIILEMLEDQGLTATSFQEGSVVLTLIEMAAEIDARLSRMPVFLKSAFFSGVARGETLTRMSGAFYKNGRNQARPSKHLVTLSCSATAGPHAINLGDVVIVHPDGHSFRNIAFSTESETYPAILASGGTLNLNFEAEVAGAQSNVGNAVTPSAVTLALDTTLAGVTITAHSLYEAGVDEESDEALDSRNTLKWAGLGEAEGIGEKYELMARSASPGIIRVAVDSNNPRGAGTFDVYIAGLDATASDDDVAKCQAVLRMHTFGKDATVQTRKAPEVELDLVGTVYFSGNFAAADVQSRVETALVAHLRSIPLGGQKFTPGPSDVVRLNDLEAVARQAVESYTLRPGTVQLTSPAADVAVVARGLVKRGNWSGLTYQAVT